MSATVIRKSFSKEWWDNFYKDSRKMTIPLVIEDLIKEDVPKLRDSIFEMLQNLKNENNFVAWRVWVDGKLDKKMKQSIIDDPIRDYSDLIPWQKRHFGDKKFGIILNNGQRYSTEARNLISNYFEPFLKDKPPFGGINFSIFIGNYGWTPIGIHEDHTGSFVMHFHLGPGDKTMYMWERSNYKGTLEGGENEEKPLGYLPFADYVCPFKEGDIFFMPWNYYHIGKSSELSLGLTVWFNYITVDGLVNGVWESGLNEIMDDEYKKINNEETVANLFNVNDTNSLGDIMNLLEEDIINTPLKDFLKTSLEDYNDALQSNGWYDRGDLIFKRDNVELKENDLIKLNGPKMIYRRSDEKIKIFHRGEKIMLHYHPDIESLVNTLNLAESYNVKMLLDGLFTDWPEGIGVRILEILCENDVLLTIND